MTASTPNADSNADVIDTTATVADPTETAKKPTPAGYSALLQGTGPAEWEDLLTSMLDDVQSIRLDARLGRGTHRAIASVGCSLAMKEGNGGVPWVHFDGTSMPIAHAIGALWHLGQRHIEAENERRTGLGKKSIQQVKLRITLRDADLKALGTSEEKLKLDEFGELASEDGSVDAGKLSLAVARDQAQESRLLRREVSDQQDRIRERDELFADFAKTFATEMSARMDRELALVTMIRDLGINGQGKSDAEIAVWNRIAGTVELIGEGVAAEGASFFTGSGSSDDKGDKEKVNKIEKLIEAISDDGWETVLDYTGISEDELENVKQKLVKMGKRRMPTEDQCLVGATAMELIEENRELLKEEMPKKDLKLFMKIAKMVDARIKRRVRHDKRQAEKAARQEAEATQEAVGE